MIKWERDSAQYSNGDIGYIKRAPFKIFYVGWKSSESGENYYLKCYLPGYKTEYPKKFKTRDEAKDVAADLIVKWLDAVDLTLKRIKTN